MEDHLTMRLQQSVEIDMTHTKVQYLVTAYFNDSYKQEVNIKEFAEQIENAHARGLHVTTVDHVKTELRVNCHCDICIGTRIAAKRV